MDYIYAGVFEKNDDGSYTVSFPDLQGCISEGKSLASALHLAEKALVQWLEYLSDRGETFPEPTDVSAVDAPEGALVNLVCANVRDNRAIRRTVSLPRWMDVRVAEKGLSLSRVLQEALKERI